MRDLKVVVIGGGIGGLTTAAALQRSGHRVDRPRADRDPAARRRRDLLVVERRQGARRARARGPRWPRSAATWSASATATVDGHDAVRLQPRAARAPRRRTPLPGAPRRPAGAAARRGRRPPAHRARAASRSSTRATTSPWSPPTARRHEGDLVVVADGTHSRFRDLVVGTPVERAVRRVPQLERRRPRRARRSVPPGSWAVHVGEGQAGVDHARARRPVLLLRRPARRAGRRPRRTAREKLREHFAGWDERVQRLIEGFDAVGCRQRGDPQHDADRLASPAGRVALLGDAAHTTAPDLGQGGCLAMEDALVLAGFLSTTSVGVEDALARYSAATGAPGGIDHGACDQARPPVARLRSRTPPRTWYRELAEEDGDRIIDGICQSIVDGTVPMTDGVGLPPHPPRARRRRRSTGRGHRRRADAGRRCRRGAALGRRRRPTPTVAPAVPTPGGPRSRPAPTSCATTVGGYFAARRQPGRRSTTS